MRNYDWKGVFNTQLLFSIVVFVIAVYQLVNLPSTERLELVTHPLLYILPVLLLIAMGGAFLAKKRDSPQSDFPLQVKPSGEDIANRHAFHSEIKNYQLHIEREIWKHENIRGWISYELHEDIGQILIAARNHLQINNHAQNLILPAQIEQARIILEEAILKVRKLYEKLEVPPLEVLGLIPCLQQKIEEVNKTASTVIKLSKINSSLENIEETSKLLIYRIITEKLNNISKHSKAKKAWIELEVNSQEIKLMIKDNGVGFYNTERVWRNGFTMIKSMIASMGGNFEMISSPGRGCNFFATIPYRKVEYARENYSDLNHW